MTAENNTVTAGDEKYISLKVAQCFCSGHCSADRGWTQGSCHRVNMGQGHEPLPQETYN